MVFPIENKAVLLYTKSDKYRPSPRAKRRNFMLKKYFEDYLSVNLADYENIGINLEISKLLILVLVGLCISFFVIDWHRGYMQLAVKKLFRHEAESEDSAKTLDELGLSKSRSVKWALSHDTRLSKIVKRVGAPEYTYEEYVALMQQKKKSGEPLWDEKIDFSAAKFYIDQRRVTEARGIAENYTSSPLKTALFSLLFIIIFISLTLIMLDVLFFINSILGD